MHKIAGLLMTVMLFLFLAGCAGTMGKDFDPPVVSLHTFRPLSQQGITPSFEIGLNIINPNRSPLELEGIYYTVDIEGYQVLAGASNNLPTVEPYSSADFTLIANVDFIRGINFISSLIQEPRDSFSYSFNAKLDPGGFNQKILVQEKGKFTFGKRM